MRTVISVILLLSMIAAAEKRICGILKDDLIMMQKHSPLIISGSVIVPVKTSVTIMPGVEIRFERGQPCSSAVDHPLAKENDLPMLIIKGRFECIGTQNNRITIGPMLSDSGSDEPSWYGLVFEGERTSTGTVAYTDIRGAVRAISLITASPTIRNNLIVNNHIAIYCEKGALPAIFNNNLMYNRASGVLIESAAPKIYNNIIAYNLAGVTGDRKSQFEMKNNAFWKNIEGDVLDCAPEYGLIRSKNDNKFPSDFRQNIFVDPVFMGSLTHRDSIEKDIRVSTDTTKGDVANKKLSRIIVETIPDSVKRDNEWNKPHKKWQLSRYSQLINAGIDKSAFKDNDGTVNDIGIYGGLEILPQTKKK
ncbi:MAG: right-handed parallel beta-helix repeat-containing protein [Fibrobacteres bacterium]|nr:right-handed parallel beta-helix repeat-containing protein [Fibrobacterota bacterium]